ncbi:uncharacterized protein M6B38_375515 [Iris pallida]|uniref:Uncharacterized protein n=1 Tax=Iris pallida TaxID=29817 RepID=A0AAX6GC24_IRIPA|nr:uncharacterized protein M6B38_375515 [Iris pallida]
MNRSRADSYPDLVLPFSNQDGPKALEGVAANVKLLLKLVQDHQDAAHGGDGRQPQRIATMLTILDDVRSRVETSKASARKAELRRCNTDLRRSAPVVPLLSSADSGSAAAKEKKPPLNPATEEIHRLRRELADSMAAQKSMGRMFSGMGKEKETIARELAMKVHELACTEEIVGYLKKQNETLSEKVRACCNEHGADTRASVAAAAGGGGGGDGGDHVLLQERNKALTEQLLKSLEGHRIMKRRLKEEREERERMLTRMAEMAEEAAAGEERARRLRETLSGGSDDNADVQEELCLLEKAFARFYRRLSPRGSPMRSE